MIGSQPRSSAADALLDLIERTEARVGVVGVGYVGLPFLVEKVKTGFHVTAIDRNERRLADILAGRSYISDVSQAELQAVVATGLVDATSSFDAIGDLDVIVICVPTPLTKAHTPDLQYVEHVAREIARHLRPGQLISLESTTYPGTTNEVIAPLLAESGLELGRDFFLAHSPERVDPGNQRYTTNNTNKVVGATDPTSLEVACAFYRRTIQNVIPVSDARVAEMVKVYENTFRAVNIALANEIALLCDRMGINVWEMLDAAFTKPFGIMPFYPGPGVGGHCIPIDPHYLEWKAREFNFETHFIALAGETNRKMPEFVVEKATRLLNDLGKPVRGSRILLLGVAYKAGIDDWRESPAIVLANLLRQRGAQIAYHDAFVPKIQLDGEALESTPAGAGELASSDLVIVTTAHPTVDYAFVVEHAKVVLDTRNATRGLGARNVHLL
ncbi:MAG: nucleotide sugar dehydrogenase [Candidatus Cybelea sp.]